LQNSNTDLEMLKTIEYWKKSTSKYFYFYYVLQVLLLLLRTTSIFTFFLFQFSVWLFLLFNKEFCTDLYKIPCLA
jgi:hypothetical protein